MDGNDDGRAPTLIRDLPQSERPRERLRDQGSAALATAELLAILLRTGSSKESALAQAQRLLRDFHGLAGLRAAAFAELCNMHGLGEAKAAQIKAALELGVRLASLAPDDRVRLTAPDDVAMMVMAEMSMLQQEELRVCVLDSRNRIITWTTAYRGSVHTIPVRNAELLREAVRVNAPAVVVVHNHPSGDPMPSVADLQMTKLLCEAGKVLDVAILDHLVIGGGKYTSVRHLQPQIFGDTAST